MGMFDWLLGDGGKAREQEKQALQQMAIQNQYNREMANAMSAISADPANADILASLTEADPSFLNNWNNQAMGMRSQANMGVNQYDEARKAYDEMEKKDRYNYFGNGMLGALLNPIGQTVSAGVDLATGNYGKNDRDVMSDLGALGSTALTFVPGVGLAGKGAKAFGSVKGMAGLGAGFGATEALREGGSDTNFSDVLSQAGTGALFGGGIGFAGNKLGGMMRNRGANNIVGKYMADNPTGAKAFLENNMTKQLRNQVVKQPNFLGNYGGLYGNALGSLVPKSTFGKVAAGGAGLYGGMKLLGGGEPDPMMAGAGGYDPYGANYDQYGGF